MRTELQAIQDKTFDLWGVGLFSGEDLVSKTIQGVTGSKWSHVATILKDQAGSKYCFECTGSATEVLRGIRPQVQISLWRDTVANYSGSVASRQFAFAPTAHPNPSDVTSFVHKYLGVVYEENLETLFRSISRANTAENAQSLFCSELTALMLQSLGYLNATGTNGRLADDYLPKDFSSKEFLPLNHDAVLSAEVLEKDDKSCCCGCVIA